MEPVASNIQVLLQAAEFLERREREAEHGYASLCRHYGPGTVYRRRKRPLQAPGCLDSGRSVHNELEKRRSWRSRSSGLNGSRRSCAANSRACSSSWSSSRGCQELESGTGCGLTVWTLPASPLSGLILNKRWMWRAWYLGVRQSCCGASALARNTATHTALAPGYDVCCPEPFSFRLD
ncbi:max dimerization protein 3 isoform X7 [Nannospalax galili]|uniref:max dimerization protein 3 isoform X7 n=1 Tax=Nannospalax galili TaxID=1026970 RepID=UPI00111C6937|nr:max dimerization protein 3 isoform X7 [Nannospalax galili]